MHPFASLATMVDNTCPRVLINLENVGDFAYDGRPNDIVLLGKCDDVVRDLCKELEWEDELLKIWEATASSVESAGGDIEASTETEEHVLNEVDRLAEDVQRALEISEKNDDNAVVSSGNDASPNPVPKEDDNADEPPRTGSNLISNEKTSPEVTDTSEDSVSATETKVIAET